MTRRTVLLITLLLVPFLTLGSGTASAQSGYCASPAEIEMLQYINAFRQDNGLQSLTLSYPLGVAAQTKAEDMATRNYWSHTSPDGVTVRQLLNNAGYTYDTAYAENLAAGNASASVTFNQWRNSPSHRDAMLDPRFVAIGIGSAYDSNSTYGWYWVSEFGGIVGEPASACGEQPVDPPAETPTPSEPSVVDQLVAVLITILTQILSGQ